MTIVVKALLALTLALTSLLGIQTFRLAGESAAHIQTKLQHEVQLKTAQAQGYEKALAESEAIRETERQSAHANQQIIDELRRRQAAAAAALASTSRELRDARAAYLSAASERDAAAATQCRSSPAPAVAILPDATVSDLVALAGEAQSVADRLVSCQQYINEVIPKTLWQTKN